MRDAEWMRANARWHSSTLKGGRLRPYQCDQCGEWHLTSASKSKDKKFKRSLRRKR